ncbi:hypothetical protein EVJ58_g3981 [Rhodofomes roseus]|uniref:Uncharacterized protein n=1 Tax=Rhodofomes roseus TaxID=34475 RepID=A0A4Y9YI93_9APHY|nr:hypothetical protein EVJ58_g3981 [Rhodofomes roseus]
MWLLVFRRKPAKPLTRLVSTTAPSKSPPQPSTHAVLLRKVYRISRYYGRKTNDPIFKLFNYIVRSPERTVPPPMLKRSGITVQEYMLWKPVILAQDLDEVILFLTNNGITIAELDVLRGQDTSARPQPPTWVVLYTLCYKVKFESDAWKALVLAYFHLPVVPTHLQPALLILAACWLAEHDLLVPLQGVVDMLLHGPHGTSLQDFHFQLLLQLIAHASSSSQVYPVVRHVIERSDTHLFNRETFDALLRSPSSTPMTGLVVWRKMEAQGYRPTMTNLARLTALYTRGRWERRARAVLRLLRSRLAEVKDEDGLPRPASSLYLSLRTESRFLSVFSSVEALHAYLRDVLETDSQQPSEDGHASGGSEVAEGEPDVDAHGATATASSDLPSGAQKQDPLDKPPGDLGPLLKIASVWKDSITVASRNSSTSSEYLRQVYDRAIRAHPLLSLDVYFHAVTIHGFLRRRDYVNALELWGKIRKYQPRLTKSTLTVGVEALTLAGRPMQALDLLFEATELQASSEARGNDPASLIDTQAVNAFMISLQRTGFTDAVFVLWDSMNTMFHARPDLYTLTILMQAGRLASKCNPSFRSAMAELGLSRFVRRGKEVESDETSRDDCFSQVERIMFAEATKGSSGLWNGERAGTVVLRIAQEIMFNNWPELKDVDSPAEALRPTGDFQGSFPMTSLLRTMLHRKAPTATPPDAQPTRGALNYPQITLNDVAFRAYIDLLASESQIPQIPLALAWMRTLGIRPSQQTLATALVYWAEVGMDAPLFEHFRDGMSQYARLKRWMNEWVGDRMMPTDEHVAVQIQRLKHFRERTRQPRLDPHD